MGAGWVPGPMLWALLPSRVSACKSSAADTGSRVLKILSTVISMVFAPQALVGKGVWTARPELTTAAGAEQHLEARHVSNLLLQYIITSKKLHKRIAEEHCIVAWALTLSWGGGELVSGFAGSSLRPAGNTVAAFVGCGCLVPAEVSPNCRSASYMWLARYVFLFVYKYLSTLSGFVEDVRDCWQ